MSIKIILVSMVLMSFGTNNFINGKVSHKLRGLLIPRLNISEARGKWYMAATTKPHYYFVCMHSDIIPKSEDNFFITVSAVLMNDTITPVGLESLNNTVFYAKISDTSDIIEVSTTPNGKPNHHIALLDSDYTSYIAFYMVKIEDSLVHSNGGIIFIISRSDTLPDGILEKIKQSNFYRHGVYPTHNLFNVNRSRC